MVAPDCGMGFVPSGRDSLDGVAGEGAALEPLPPGFFGETAPLSESESRSVDEIVTVRTSKLSSAQ